MDIHQTHINLISQEKTTLPPKVTYEYKTATMGLIASRILTVSYEGNGVAEYFDPGDDQIFDIVALASQQARNDGIVPRERGARVVPEENQSAPFSRPHPRASKDLVALTDHTLDQLGILLSKNENNTEQSASISTEELIRQYLTARILTLNEMGIKDTRQYTNGIRESLINKAGCLTALTGKLPVWATNMLGLNGSEPHEPGRLAQLIVDTQVSPAIIRDPWIETSGLQTQKRSSGDPNPATHYDSLKASGLTGKTTIAEIVANDELIIKHIMQASTDSHEKHMPNLQNPITTSVLYNGVYYTVKMTRSPISSCPAAPIIRRFFKSLANSKKKYLARKTTPTYT